MGIIQIDSNRQLRKHISATIFAIFVDCNVFSCGFTTSTLYDASDVS